MNKKADWTIEDCNLCHHCSYDEMWHEGRCTYKSKKGKFITDEHAIPKWCPLEDAEE